MFYLYETFFYVCTNIQSVLHMCVRACVYCVFVHRHPHVKIHTSVRVRLHTHTHTHTHIYVYIYKYDPIPPPLPPPSFSRRSAAQRFSGRRLVYQWWHVRVMFVLIFRFFLFLLAAHAHPCTPHLVFILQFESKLLERVRQDACELDVRRFDDTQTVSRNALTRVRAL
jgi:hypothetical protein